MAGVMKKGFARWDAVEMLVDHPEDAALFLEACIDEDLGDGRVILAALHDIARARNMTKLAEDAGLTRAGVYRALSEGHEPGFTTVLKIIQALGLRLKVEVAPRLGAGP